MSHPWDWPLGVRVTVQARRARPHITVHSRVLIIHLGLTVLVAMRATELLLVGRVQVTIRTSQVLVWTAIDTDGMIEHSTQPSRGIVMTERAIGTKTRRRVVGVGRVLEIRQVTVHAIGGQTDKHTALVTNIASDTRMTPG